MPWYTGAAGEPMIVNAQGSGETDFEGNALPTSIFGTDVSGSETPVAGTPLGNWIQQNKTVVYAGAGFLAFLALFGRRGR